MGIHMVIKYWHKDLTIIIYFHIVLPELEKISEEDYYRLNVPFCKWLLKEKGKYFEEIDSSRARKYFFRFVKEWNKNRLDEKYYRFTDDPSTLKEEFTFTNHKWNFKKNDSEEHKDIKHRSVSSSFVSRNDKSEGHFREKTIKELKLEGKLKNRKQNERLEEALEQFASKETGRRAEILEKRARNRFYHADKDYDINIPEAELYEESSFKQALFEQKKHERRRQFNKDPASSKNADPSKIKAYMDKENDTIEMLRQLAYQNQRK
ncbi:hypothetical protein BB560_002294 [Smittium megazygosporum]|uniref:Uncharacterized protein n=1 Tax=Smittium megazygosporum TaxID=133381 RepID=A0A2T9ZFC2_9FUNG|nr:hypothetical protein BB560_002294 [Smittium megazygosporum]